MPRQFKNMNELVEYLEDLEERVRALEAENRNLRIVQSRNEDMHEDTIERYIYNYIPQTNLLGTSFFTRAFAVWGHYTAANIIIGLMFAVIYFCAVLLGLTSLIWQIPQ